MGRTTEQEVIADLLQHEELISVVELKRQQFEARRNKNKEKRATFLMGDVTVEKK